jgi:hypothetical protein
VVEASADPGTKTDALRAAPLGKRGIAIETADNLGGALGTSTSERIQILNGLSPAETFVALAHEYAHLCAESGYVRFLLVSGRARASAYLIQST